MHDGRSVPVAEFLGKGGDPTRENGLEPGAIITAVTLPAPEANERSFYFRATNRASAEWPLSEVAVRLVADETVRFARVAVGAVANIPLRLPRVEEALVGKEPNLEVLQAAAALATENASPLPLTGYKLEILQAAVLEALEQVLTQPPVGAGS